MDGILNIDKPKDWTSHDVVAAIRSHFKIKKVGHAGTLDPNATGVLLICLGRATKKASFLTGQKKTYEGTVLLGTTTDTQDIKGKIIKKIKVEKIDTELLSDILEDLIGEISQIPPMYSAVHYKGGRLYKLARKGIKVDPAPRKVHVYSIELLDINIPEISMRVVCSKGTYIRTLANTIGEKLGYGACLKDLRRIQVGDFHISDSLSIKDVLAMGEYTDSPLQCGKRKNMDIIKKLVPLKRRYPRAVLTMGNFDGMHIGHKKIIDRVIEEAKRINGTSIVLTFTPHPIKVLKPEIVDLLLTSEEHKIKLIERTGVDVCISIDFASIVNMKSEEFVSEVLCNYIHVRKIFVGFNYRFGVGQQGDAKLLEQMGEKNNFSVEIIKPVKISSEIVSSTKVRECIKEGNLDKASGLLGRRYSVMGDVSKGSGISRDIDFPTANIYCDIEVTPPEGVYAAYAIIHINDKRLVCEAVLDARKQNSKFFLEVYIFNIKTDLYGKTIEVFFIKKLRDRHKFCCRQDAKKQISCDTMQAREILKKALHANTAMIQSDK